MYFEAYILSICNNYEYGVGMNCMLSLLKLKTEIVNIYACEM
jgi:hypothetical protein